MVCTGSTAEMCRLGRVSERVRECTQTHATASAHCCTHVHAFADASVNVDNADGFVTVSAADVNTTLR